MFLFLRFEMKLSSLFVLLSAFAVQRVWAAQTCDANYGPSGVTECVLLSEYYGYQWATCLTNAYIQQKSNQKHICKYIYATYCWYQCMIEVHDKSDGTVTETVHVNLSIRLPNHTLVFLQHHCLQSATALLEIRVIGTETAWKRSTHARIPAMHTLSNTLRSFVGYMMTDIPYLVRRDGNGWMLFVSVFKCP